MGQKTLAELYQEAADLTNAICARCAPPFSCCELAGCVAAMNWSSYRLNGTPEPLKDSVLPYLGPSGCVLPPYQRPLCTLWLCAKAERPPRLAELAKQIGELEKERQ